MQLPAQIGQTPCNCHTAGNSKSGQKGLLSEMLCSRQIIGDDCVHAVVEGASGNEGNGSGDEKRRRGRIAASGKNFGIQSGTETGQQIGKKDAVQGVGGKKISQPCQKPAHTGELFEIELDKLTMVALDGYRLAIVERPITAVKDIRIIVPSKTMTEVSHLLANDDEEDVHISANRRYVVFTTAGYTIMSRLIEGEFLNYRNVIPAGSRTRVTIDTKDFISTIERASLIITERLKNPLRISFTEGKVVVRCQTNLGRVVDGFSAACEGDEVEIGFNNRYLLDALRNARTEQVRMEISGPLSPVKVLPVEGNDFLYLVLPVRFKND